MKNTSSRFFGLGKMIPFIRPYIVGMLVMILLGTLSSVADSIYPLFNRYAINHYIALGTLDTLTTFILLYLWYCFCRSSATSFPAISSERSNCISEET